MYAATQSDAELRIATKHKRRAPDEQARIDKNLDLARLADQDRIAQAEARKEPEQEIADAPPPREDVESIEVELLDKRKVTLGPPKGVSLTMRIAMTLPEATTNP